MNVLKPMKWSVWLIATVVLFTQCTEDDTINPAVTGELNLEITDAPIDDASVKGAFITVSEVRIDGETFEGFEGKQTIDLMAYQNGQVKALGLSELEAGTYSDITLVLDFETDAVGNQPGCYVLTEDNTRYNLSTNISNEITFTSESFEIKENSRTNLVIDFDLRKAIRRADSGSQSNYSFVTDAEMRTAIRVVDKDRTGKAKGECQGGFTFSDKVVVYAYKKGTYNENLETQGQGTSNIRFKNAVTSANVQADGSYQLDFLEEGDYELYFMAYEDTNSDGQFELTGTLILDLLGSLGIDLNNVSIDANATVNINVLVTGVTP